MHGPSGNWRILGVARPLRADQMHAAPRAGLRNALPATPRQDLEVDARPFKRGFSEAFKLFLHDPALGSVHMASRWVNIKWPDFWKLPYLKALALVRAYSARIA